MNLKLPLLASFLLHCLVIGGFIALGFEAMPPSRESEPVFVEISAEPPPIGSGPGAYGPRAAAAMSSEAVSETVSLNVKPAVLKPIAAPRRISANVEAGTRARANLQLAGDPSSREDGNGGGGGGGQGLYGSPNGVPGGTGSLSPRIRLLYAPKPPYPWPARRDGFEGRVVFDVVVGPDGRLQDARVVQSSGREDCDEAALETVRDEWRFAAAEVDGHGILSQARFAVRYMLE